MARTLRIERRPGDCMRAPGQAGVTWYPLPYVSFLLVTLVFRDCLPPERLTRAEIRRKQAERADAEAV